MPEVAVQANEKRRLSVLREYGVLDTPAEAIFDEVTRLAAFACDTPIAFTAFYDADRVWFKSVVGLEGITQLPREAAICVQAMTGADLIEIADASRDPRFKHSPMVAAGPGVRLFAAVPLINPRGDLLGSLSVASTKPGSLTVAQQRALNELGKVVVSLLEARRTRDAATRLGVVLDSAFNAIFVVDPLSLRILHANQGAQRTLAYSLEELRERVLPEVIPALTRDRIQEALAPINTGTRPIISAEQTLRRRDGEEFVAELHLQISQEEHGSTLVLIANDVSQRREAERKLQASEARLRMIADNMPALISYVDPKGIYRFANDTYTKWFDRPLNEIIGRKVLDFLPTEAAARARPHLERAFRGERVRFENQHDGRTVEVELVPDMVDGKVWGLYSLVFDVSPRVKAERALRSEKERLQATLLSIGDAVAAVDGQGRVELLNPVAEKLSGWLNEEAQGLPFQQVLNFVDQTTREPIDNPIHAALRQGETGTFPPNTILIGRDGREFPVEDSATPIVDEEGEVVGSVLVFRDVTASREILSRMEYQARHDALTGLSNRREFETTAGAFLQSARNEGHEHAMVYLDLDQFKVVNDTCGHQAGDQLLCQIADLLQRRLRKSDLLARLGGDEFGVLLQDCPVPKANQIAQGLVNDVAGYRFLWQDKIFAVGASAGVVAITHASKDLQDIMISADTACYVAKDKGRGRVQLFQSDDRSVTGRRVEADWVSRLNEAFDNHRFRLYCQRIIPLGGHSDEGGEEFEILLRLKDEAGEIVPPMAFLPAAERYNLMPRIDRWVIRAALTSLTGAAPEARYSINLSGASLNDESLFDYIAGELAKTGVPARCICFEITETSAVANLSKALELVGQLKQLGCRFALDDFGSGLSSFSYLKHFPVDYLKIDGSLVKDLATDPVHYAMVEAVNRIGHTMGIKTVAEYVEQPETMAGLRSIGVDYAQGYYVEHPGPFERFDWSEHARSETAGALH